MTDDSYLAFRYMLLLLPANAN